MLGNPAHGRLLEREGVARPHKHIRTSSSILCPQILPAESDKQSSLPKDGQYHGSCLPTQHRRHSLPQTTPSSIGGLGVVREEEYISSSTAHPGQDKCRGGCRVAGETRFERLENTSKGNSSFKQVLHSGPLCLSPDASTKAVRQLEVRPERNAHRCVHDGLVEPGGICLPSIQSTSSSTSQSQKGGSNASVGCTSMDRTTLVASTDRTNCRLPNLSRERSQITTGCVQSRGNTPPFSLSEVSRMDNIRQHYKTMGISETAVDLLCNSVKSTTTKTYNVSWTQWSRWCSERKSDPVLCPISDILTFLAEQFSKGKEYRTVNVLRSAISS